MSKIPEETLKQWRDDSLSNFGEYINSKDEISSDSHKEYLLKITDYCKTLKNHFIWEVNIVSGISFMAGYLAAKTSSYELKETLRKRGNDLAKENVKLQERITEQDEELQACGLQQHLFEKDIAKRDLLIEQVKVLSKRYLDGDLGRDSYFTRIEQWLKQVEELKGEKL